LRANLILATRQSPLALAQAELAGARLRSVLGVETELKRIVTTGDRRADWSLEKKGGKGLFTAELEESLLRGEADLAIHSTKDLPGEMAPGLTVAGYLPRADPRDVLIVREGVTAIHTVATDSPRRRMQLALRLADLEFSGIRGNVETRLKKIVEGAADATVLAAAGLARLGLSAWPGLEFRPFAVDAMVPAVGQGAIALQCRSAEATRYADGLDAPTARTVGVERAFQALLGGGCHTAFAAHVSADTLHLFHEKVGQRQFRLASADFASPPAAAGRILRELGLI
jgi:hydroxymethylbilane synthase